MAVLCLAHSTWAFTTRVAPCSTNAQPFLVGRTNFPTVLFSTQVRPSTTVVEESSTTLRATHKAPKKARIYRRPRSIALANKQETVENDSVDDEITPVQQGIALSANEKALSLLDSRHSKREIVEDEIVNGAVDKQADVAKFTKAKEKEAQSNDTANGKQIPEVWSMKNNVTGSVAVADEETTLHSPKTEHATALGNANVVCAQAFAAVDQHPILLFDGACNLCNDWVNFCLDYDVHANFRFASLQSKVGKSILIRNGRSPDDYSDIILATPQETYARTDAVLRVVSQLEGLPIVLRIAATSVRIFFPPWFRDAAYKILAANRHILGDTDGPVCRLDLDGEYFGRFIEDPELEDDDANVDNESKEKVYA